VNRRRRAALLGAAALLLPACTVRIGGSSSTSAGGGGEKRVYRVRVEQTRRGAGIAKAPARSSTVTATLIEERTSDSLVITVDKAAATGERAVVDSVGRIEKKVVSIRFGPGGVTSATIGVAGSDDLHSLDVALLFEIVSPVVPSGTKVGGTWTSTASGVAAPWSGEVMTMHATNRLTGSRWVRWVHGRTVATEATGKVAFLVPLTQEAPPPASAKPATRTPLLSEVFATLFTPVKDGDVATIAKGVTGALLVPALAPALAMVDVFTAFGDALSGFFGGGSSAPRRATIRLDGPIELHATTAVGGGDSRVLQSSGRGSMKLTGRLPPLSGPAAGLSERPITIDAAWVYRKDLVRPWPFGLLGPALALLIADVAGLVIVIRRRRRATRNPAAPA
jgi:hypothetical protein